MSVLDGVIPPLDPSIRGCFPDLATCSYWNYVPVIGLFTEHSRIMKVSERAINEIVDIANDNQTKEAGQHRLIQLLKIRMDYRYAPEIRTLFTVVLCIIFVIAWTMPFLAIIITLLSIGDWKLTHNNIERDRKFIGELERKRIPQWIYDEAYQVPDLR